MNLLLMSKAFAADASGEYLKYQEPAATTMSGFSIFSYVISLLFTFGVVVALAYFTSRFWGNKLNLAGRKNSSKILSSLSLGTNRAVYVVEMAGEYLVLGVTDHNITLLQTITDPDKIHELLEQNIQESETFQAVFRSQLHSLQHMSHKFPEVFGRDKMNKERKNALDHDATDIEKR
ncbi:MAG: flagellar biosynthetic protein FliO [Sporomusaceae bacterium]|nr:flagellar biosynthetic protein FliO [Sporomusaceae bacterium]